MHALVCEENGKYYVSAVFGFYRDITATDDYRRYVQEIHNAYWIVWNREKTRLIRWHDMAPDTEYLISQIIIVDREQKNWVKDGDGVGCVDFLSRGLLDSFLDEETQPADILRRCRDMDSGYEYEEFPEVTSDKNIDNLMWASGGFHDARIEKEELWEDDSLYLKFTGTWGCDIEIWFWGDVAYDTSSRDPRYYDPYWSDATVLIQDGFIYLIDDEGATVGNTTEGYCWFKARHMKYHIVPV